MDEDIYPDELYHYGRKGMKWGQHIFGKERSSGTKRKKKSENVENRFVSGVKSAASKVSAARAKTKEDKRVQKLKKKKISDMTDDELAEYTDRMNRERMAANARNTVTQANPQHVSKGQAFITSLGRDVLAPAAKNVGRQYIEKVLRDQLGLNNTGNSDPLKALRDEVDKLNLENKKGALTDSINKRNKEHEEAAKKAKTSDSSSTKNDSSNNTKTDTSTKNDSNNKTSSRTNNEPTYETPNRSSNSSSSRSTEAEDVYVASGYSFIEQNRRLLNAPIAGLLPPADDDRYR